MRSSRRRSVAQAAAAIFCLVLLMAPPGRATHGDSHPNELLPNLQTFDLGNNSSTGIAFSVVEASRLLRFDNEVVNSVAGAGLRGPLEVFSRRVAACGEGQTFSQAYQRIYYDSNGTGKYERKRDKVSREIPVGCMEYHEAHQHWHFEHFAEYELYPCISDGLGPCMSDPSATPLSGEKVTFCIADVYKRSDAIDSPAGPQYGTSCGRQSSQGLSVGWGDQYTQFTFGQSLSISSLTTSGTYCFVSTADPNNQLLERLETDNRESIRLILTDRTDDTNALLDHVTKDSLGCWTPPAA